MKPIEIRHNTIQHIYQYPTDTLTAQAAAQYAKDLLHPQRHPVVTFATGNTMIPVLQHLAELSNQPDSRLQHITAFHLDEYYPQDPLDEVSFVHFLYTYAFGPLNLKPEKIHTLNGQATDPLEEARRYEKLIRSYKMHLTFLGVGPGGHIGFNEAGTPFSSVTHLQQLSEETVQRDKERGQHTSDQALTQGISTILRAEHLVLVAYGNEKGQILREALYGNISPDVPASALRKVGKKVVMFVDESAADAIKG